MAVTIKDVAARCGLSISTVSKAFNHYSDISQSTRELVRRTAQEIGYYPNAVARTLKTNHSFNLGVLFAPAGCSELLQPFSAAVLGAFKVEAEHLGYDLTFISHQFGHSSMTYLEHCLCRNVDGVCLACADFSDPEIQELASSSHLTFISHQFGHSSMTYLEHCLCRNVDGVCLACADFSDPEIQELASSSHPLVTIDHPFPNRSCVLSENQEGMEWLVRHAFSLGHRKIACVHGRPTAVTQQRMTGYQLGLAACGLPFRPEWVRECTAADPEQGHLAARSLWLLPDPPTCILMPDDVSCLGAMEAAEELGLRIPLDVSVAGYGGLAFAQLLTPRLTTVRQNTEELGAQAARCLVAQIEHPQETPVQVTAVPGRLIPGETLGQMFPLSPAVR